jgi:hypothetical protein
MQLLTLRTLLVDTTNPVPTEVNGTTHWMFEFEIKNPAELGHDNDRLTLLEKDCKLVPMLTGLDENADTGQYLVPGSNIWFDPISTK